MLSYSYGSSYSLMPSTSERFSVNTDTYTRDSYEAV